jgi:hypothetical protein
MNILPLTGRHWSESSQFIMKQFLAAIPEEQRGRPERRESRREGRRTERSNGEEAVQTTWIHDAGVELRRAMRGLATQVHDVEVGVGTRGTNTRTREARGLGDKRLRSRK